MNSDRGARRADHGIGGISRRGGLVPAVQRKIYRSAGMGSMRREQIAKATVPDHDSDRAESEHAGCATKFNPRRHRRVGRNIW